MTKEKKLEYVNEKKTCYDVMDKNDLKKMDNLIWEYKDFLQENKTERLVVKNSIKILKKNWFVDIEDLEKNLKNNIYKFEELIWKKVYFNFRDKNLFATVIWKNELSKGIRLIWSHIDSPRIDLKYKPVIENNGMCLLKTHYYWWIKKYQRLTIPISIIWVIFDKNWKKIEISIWEKEDDPVLFLSDLLPHLWINQMNKKAEKVVEGEEMNVLIWTKYSIEKKEKVKNNVLKILFEKYWITEDSFSGADLSLVPAQKVRYVWIDKSMIWGYGQDDRVCSFMGLKSLLDLEKVPNYTWIMNFSDKEEIWSTGTTGSQSRVFTYFLQRLMNLYSENVSMLDVDNCCFNSYAISADVTACLDPNFAWVYDDVNSCYINQGIAIEKFTGHWWKYDWSEAEAEYTQKIKEHLKKNNILFQFAWLWKVDLWWWWSICKYLAHLWFNIIDMGVGVLNMHAPFEVASCADIYMTYKAYHCFWDL